MTTDTNPPATPKRSPLLCAIEDDAMIWLDESSQKLSQLAALFETIRDMNHSVGPSHVSKLCRIEALAELGRAIADDISDSAGCAHDRVYEAIKAAKAIGELR